MVGDPVFQMMGSRGVFISVLIATIQRTRKIFTQDRSGSVLVPQRFR